MRDAGLDDPTAVKLPVMFNPLPARDAKPVILRFGVDNATNTRLWTSL
jgi:hypothetical protein